MSKRRIGPIEPAKLSASFWKANLILVIIFSLQSLPVSARDFNILQFGAVADGVTLNTTFIQAAIDAAHADGGGRVIIPHGQFLSGSVILKSKVELHLLEGAVLLGSTNPKDYIKLNRWKALVMADGQEQLTISGKGTIDGQGRALALHIDSLFYAGQIDSINYNFVEMRPKEPMRPQLVEMVNCKFIRIIHVTMINGACWLQTYEKCEQLVMDSLRIVSDAYWNNDGIDISDCRHVRITNCYVDTADDAICLKSHDINDYCDGIYIADCTIRSSASAIKFGTASYGGFKNVTIERIRVHDTFRSAIALESVDGGFIENVKVNDVQATNTGNAIFIRLGKRNKNRPPGYVRNISIKNMTVDIAFERPDYEYEIRGPALPFFHNIFPSSIAGIPGYHIENVTLENIDIRYPGKGNNGLANAPLSRLHRVPEREASYPEFSMFGELPAWGFYIRHAKGIQMKNIKLQIDHPDYRPAMVLDDVSHTDFQKLLFAGDAKPDHIILYKSTDVQVDNEECVKTIKQ